MQKAMSITNNKTENAEKLAATEAPVADQFATGALAQFSDAELLDAWARDQLADAFAVLVERYGVMVWAVCRRKCLTHSDADDAYQTTFLLLAKNSEKVKRPECLGGWLHRVAQRASVATLHGRSKSQPTEVELAMTDDPLDKIAQQHDAIVLDEELAALPDHYRAALVMHVYDDCPLQQMADHFQTSLGTIRGRLKRGKKMLAGRLRRRGIVPVLAVAAAGANAFNPAEASAAGTSLLESISSGQSPSPPIPENLLSPLVASGKKIMTPWNVVGGLVAAGTIVAMSMIPGTPSTGGGTDASSSNSPVSIRAEQEPIAAQFTAANPAPPQDPVDENNAAGAPVAAKAPEGGATPIPPPRFAPFSSTPLANQTPTIVKRRYRPSTATSPVAEALRAKMDTPVELQINGALATLADQLESQLDQPVIFSDRAIAYAKLEPATPVEYTTRLEPLRTALRKMLRPLGLKATIEDEALVVTADHGALVHQGIGTDRWLNVDDAWMQTAEQSLQRPLSVTFRDSPLSEAADQLSQEIDLPITIDHRSLEEIGIDDGVPVNVDVKAIAGYHVLMAMLRDMDLTITFRDGTCVVVTREAADDALLNRVYWLEGLGLNGDYDGIMSVIETIIQSDSWEALGGSSTMSPTPGSRPGIVVSTTYDVHREIEQLVRGLRENSFSLDAVPEEVQVPVPASSKKAAGGGGFM